MTVYMVTPFHLVRLPFLGVRTKQLTAWNLQKLCADRDPVSTFVPKNKVETSYTTNWAPAPCPNSSVGT